MATRQQTHPIGARALVEAALLEVSTLDVAQARALLGRDDVLFVDVREPAERDTEGVIPGAFHAPRGVLEFWADPAGDWQRPALCRPGVRLLLYCAVGWRSALAAQSLQRMGRDGVAHLGGGLVAWKAAGAPWLGAEQAAPEPGQARRCRPLELTLT
jgi:rhodanese-related sulfurtransferase